MSISRIKWLLGMALYLIILPFVFTLLLTYLIFLYLCTFLPVFLTERYFRPMTRLWCKLFTKALLVDLKVEYANDKAIPENYILIANHPSIFEDFGIPAYFDVHPLAKAGVRDWWFLGRVSEYGGTIFVKRSDRDSRKNALEAMRRAADTGKNLVIFPEGGCMGKDIQQSFKTGAFESSMESGVPILPVYLHYIDEDVFEWTDQSIVKKVLQILFSYSKRVRYIVHEPEQSDGYQDKFEFAEAMRLKYMRWQQECRNRKWN